MSEEADIQTEIKDQADEPQLYAGKFKSIEDLEKAYKEGFSVHLKNKELESKINDYTNVPDEYQIPEGIHLRENKLNEIKELARSAKLNQSQFKEAVNKVNSDYSKQLSDFDEQRKAVGDENINVLQKYVDNKFNGFDDSFRSNILSQAIKDENIRNKLMSERDKDLNSQLPGSSSTANSVSRTNDMKRELHDAALRCKLDSRDKNAREKYINLCRDVAHAKMENQK